MATVTEVAQFLGKYVVMEQNGHSMQGTLLRLDFDGTIEPKVWVMVDYGYAMCVNKNLTIRAATAEEVAAAHE